MPGHAEGREPPCGFDIARQISLSGIRALLADLRARLANMGVPDDRLGEIEICLAEALNNIVEHGYAPTGEGPVRVRGQRESRTLWVEIRDQGVAMPGLSVPQRRRPDTDVPLEQLPEGGFGWFLIRSLSSKLAYTRRADENSLEIAFHLPS